MTLDTDERDAILRELAEWCQWDDPSDCGDLIECPLCKQLAIRGETIHHDLWCQLDRARRLVAAGMTPCHVP